MTQDKLHALKVLIGMQEWRTLLTWTMEDDRYNDFDAVREIACLLYNVEQNQTRIAELLRQIGNRMPPP